jgi:hypothetical protein
MIRHVALVPSSFATLTSSCLRSCHHPLVVDFGRSTYFPLNVSRGKGRNHFSSSLLCDSRSHRWINFATIAHSLDKVGLSRYSRSASINRFRSHWTLILGLSLCHGFDLLVKHLAKSFSTSRAYRYGIGPMLASALFHSLIVSRRTWSIFSAWISALARESASTWSHLEPWWRCLCSTNAWMIVATFQSTVQWWDIGCSLAVSVGLEDGFAVDEIDDDRVLKASACINWCRYLMNVSTATLSNVLFVSLGGSAESNFYIRMLKFLVRSHLWIQLSGWLGPHDYLEMQGNFIRSTLPCWLR